MSRAQKSCTCGPVPVFYGKDGIRHAAHTICKRRRMQGPPIARAAGCAGCKWMAGCEDRLALRACNCCGPTRLARLRGCAGCYGELARSCAGWRYGLAQAEIV